MIDPMQVLFIVVVTVLIVFLALVGFQLFVFLKELRQTLKKVNNILEDVDVITSSVSTPVEKLAGLLESLQHGVGIFNFISRLIDKKIEKYDSEE
ncbi:hypothetical protein GYA19_01745 [Candidatus Beckwithbacteria bacterium]|nr:hypothetical protein [Candidatus Beckwithbacteria bacterium]